MVIANLLRAAPVFSSVGAIALSAGLTAGGGCASAGAVTALGAGLCGIAGDILAYVLKVSFFGPIYTHAGRSTLPVLGQGPRPAGAQSCGFWPYGHSAVPTRSPGATYGMPSGHAAHACAMLAFVLRVVASAPHALGWGWWASVALLGALTVAVPVSRVVLGCHTWGQVFWGCMLGALGGGAAAGPLLERIWPDGTCGAAVA
jgi:membrane-associated phospholipid phosphatase